MELQERMHKDMLEERNNKRLECCEEDERREERDMEHIKAFM